MKIPKQYEVMGQTIKIRQLVNLTDDCGATGLCKFMKGVIDVQKKTSQFSDDYIDITLKHEIVHSWFSSLGYVDLNSNEKLVDELASVWHQYEKTRKY